MGIHLLASRPLSSGVLQIIVPVELRDSDLRRHLAEVPPAEFEITVTFLERFESVRPNISHFPQILGRFKG